MKVNLFKLYNIEKYKVLENEEEKIEKEIPEDIWIAYFKICSSSIDLYSSLLIYWSNETKEKLNFKLLKKYIIYYSLE